MRLFFIIFLSLLSCFIYGQDVSSSQNPTLQKARELAETNPKQAIEIINNVLNTKSKRNIISPLVKAEAHELLGDINVQIELYSQATDRYKKAITLSNSLNNKELQQKLNRKLGETFLLFNPTESIQYFDNCLSIVTSNKDKFDCLEGKADGLIAIDSTEKAIEILQSLEKEFIKNASPDLARIQAKIANGYAKNNQIDKAVINYNIAQQNYSTPTIKDDKVFQNSTNSIALKQNSNEQIQLRNSNIGIYSRQDKVAEEMIEIAEIYVKQGNNNSAMAKLKELKPIVKTLPEKTKADYFKKSSEVFALQGNYAQALESYEQYQEANNLVLLEKEKQLDNKIEINELQKEIDINEQESINTMDRKIYRENMVERQQWIIVLLCCLLLGALFSFIAIYRNVRSKQKANTLLELRSLRSEMNPHFIFNALGSVNNFIAEKDSRKANKYLSDFSKLMRAAMEMNKHDLIPLREELEFSVLYLNLEHKRWEDKFDSTIEIDWESIPDDLMVPPLLIQPYIENAIWHGLRYKESKGHLLFTTEKHDKGITIKIIDDGIGRDKSKELKTRNQLKYKSTGLKNTQKRTSLINKIYHKNYQTIITDNSPNSLDKGTAVTIFLTT